MTIAQGRVICLRSDNMENIVFKLVANLASQLEVQVLWFQKRWRCISNY